MSSSSPSPSPAAAFKRGSAVEVSSEDQGLKGSWYTATVIDTSGPHMVVEYHNLCTDESEATKLREEVDPILVRPVPPMDPYPVFEVMKDVDAFHNDGWWEGVVTAVNPNNNSYSVFFRCSREQIDFTPPDLRVHREWLGGDRWDPPFLPPATTPSSSRQKRKSPEGGSDPSKNVTSRKGSRHAKEASAVHAHAHAHAQCSPRPPSRHGMRSSSTTPHITRNGYTASLSSGRRASRT